MAELTPTDVKNDWEVKYKELVLHQFERNEGLIDRNCSEISKLWAEMKLIKWKVGVVMFFLGGGVTLLAQIIARKLGWL
jgi:hypothetical protein